MRVVPGCVAFLFACGLAAQTFVVDAANGPGTNFTSLAVATATVPDGAVLEVRPGNYGAFGVFAKSMTIHGGPGVFVTTAQSTAITVVGVAPNQQVEIDGLEIGGELRLTGCAGLVLMHRSGSGPSSLAGCLLRATDCSSLHVSECRFGSASAFGTAVHLQRSSATATGSTFMSSWSTVVVTVDASVNLVDCGVSVFWVGPGNALSLGNSSVRAVRCQIDCPASNLAIYGTGQVRADLATQVVGAIQGVTLNRADMPAVRASGGALGSNVAVAMTGPNGHAGALFVGLPGPALQLPSAVDPLWLQPATLTVCFVATFASGVPQQSVYLIPNVAAFRGVRLAWQGATVDAAGAVQLSNPAITSHW